MGEEGRIKVQADLDGPRPRDPVLELLDAQLVAVHLAALHLSVAGVEVEAVAAGHDRKCLLEVCPQFIGCAGLAGVVAGDGQSAAERLAGVLKAPDIITLPAMDGNRDAVELLEGFVGVHAQGGVAFFGEAISLVDLFRGAHIDSHI